MKWSGSSTYLRLESKGWERQARLHEANNRPHSTAPVWVAAAPQSTSSWPGNRLRAPSTTQNISTHMRQEEKHPTPRWTVSKCLSVLLSFSFSHKSSLVFLHSPNADHYSKTPLDSATLAGSARHSASWQVGCGLSDSSRTSVTLASRAQLIAVKHARDPGRMTRGPSRRSGSFALPLIPRRRKGVHSLPKFNTRLA